VTELLSPCQKKKTKHLPQQEIDTESDTGDPGTHPLSDASSHCNSVIDIAEGNSDDELSEYRKLKSDVSYSPVARTA
jgi:hypothetical protein